MHARLAPSCKYIAKIRISNGKMQHTSSDILVQIKLSH